jgi:NAD(P)-dependent dehydrogenase (short-subunit alcohol dehydrogenase family)
VTTSLRTALITGGTSGIGRATAELLHERGYRVAVTGRSAASVDQARAELPDDILVIRADARVLADTERAVAEVGDRFGHLTTLFINAGITGATPLGTVDEARWDEIHDTNTKGSYFTLQYALPLLTDGAAVIFTGGLGATPPFGIAGGSAVAASRGALVAMVPSLALELAPRGIRVNAVSPGAIETPIWGKSDAPAEAIEARKAAIAARTPLGRFGTAREIAETVAFLASDGAAYLTGQTIVVAGGGGLG